MSNGKFTSFEQVLEQTGTLVYTNVGVSMLPLLRQGRDLMVIARKEPGKRCHKYDAVLYRRKNGQYVLHRILKVRPEDYVLCGDHCYSKEYGITDEQILGVLRQVVRKGGKTLRVTDPVYRCYVHLWCDFYPIRAVLLWIRQKIRRVHCRSSA